ncbi:hypothetical protein Palpr_0570 [Paludibacter propionicigenes WB4]|uniref:Uncharacterized protein n=1 Tax=Paludibacter propionicigenes (strain DSM 17365 / JCM 13257 / WB4) TaxID=694427 RepID=E4T1Y5_PALPW|nr:carboxypeptidase-like regulatory domain-containing protein [Paludibacter propionicigenes]ADQ78729.1 hypothetical protein Palpr_0570 [Paludibacter propionicigenes WB4]
MTSKQSSIYSMLRRIVAFLRKESNALSVFIVLNTLQPELERNLDEIDLLKEQQATDIKGLSQQKDALRKTATQKAIEVCKALQLYAQMSDNIVLANEVAYTATDFRKASDNEVDTYLSVIYSAGMRYQSELQEYGVTPNKLPELKTAIDAFKAAIGTPKGGTISRKQITDRMGALFTAEMLIIEKIDLLIDTLKFTNTPLYTEYQDNRKIVYFSSSLMVNSTITDAETGLGLPGVVITFILDGVTVLEKTTGDNGGTNIKSIEPGVYTVQLSKPAYISQTFTISIPGDDLITITATMTKESGTKVK